MTMRMSVPIEEHTSRRGSMGESIRRIVRLVFRNLWRSGVMPLLPLVIAIGVWFAHVLMRDEIVLWHDVSVSIAMSYAVIGPLCAALAAWTSGRAHRRKMEDQLKSASLPPWQQDLLSFATAAGIGVLSYGGAVVLLLGWAAVHATWGTPYGVVLLSGLLGVVFFSLFGAAVGMLWPHHLTSLLVLAVTGGSVMYGSTIQNWGPDANARELTLWNILLDFQHGFSVWVTTRTSPSLIENMTMLAALSLVVIVAIPAIRHGGRTPLALAGLVALVAGISVITTMTGDRVMTDRVHPMNWNRATFQYECTDANGIELCLHPAWTARQDNIAHVVSTFFVPIAGLEGVPDRVVQVGSNLDETSDGGVAIHLWGGEDIEPSLSHELAVGVFPRLERDPGVVSDAEQVIAGWLMQQAGGSPMLFIPRGPDYQATAETREQELMGAIDRFSALSPEEQRAWLAANWDALRAGELTLEDLP